MEIQNITPILGEKYAALTRKDVKSVHYGEADPQDVRSAYENPKAFAKAAGVESADESQYTVTTLQRQDRHPHRLPSKIDPALVAQPRVASRRAVIIVIHYQCCCADILILGW
jgi:hypothetical protein